MSTEPKSPQRGGSYIDANPPKKLQTGNTWKTRRHLRSKASSSSKVSPLRTVNHEEESTASNDKLHEGPGNNVKGKLLLLAADHDDVKRSPVVPPPCNAPRCTLRFSEEQQVVEEELAESISAHTNVDTFIEQLSSAHYRTLQSLCNHGGTTALDNQEFGITARDWRLCYANGQNCRDKMAVNISSMIREKIAGSRASNKARDTKGGGVPQNKDHLLLFSGAEVEKIRGLMEAIPNRYYGTLQTYCNTGGGPWFEEFADRVSPVLWKACYDNSNNARNVMVRNIRKMFKDLIIL